MNLQDESKHWFGHSLKDFRECHPKLLEYAMALEFELKLYKEGATVNVPTTSRKPKKNKGRNRF